MKGNVIRLNIMHLNSVHLNSIGEVQSVSLKAGESTEDPVYPPTTYTLAANVSNGKVTATKNGTAISLPYVAAEGDAIVLSVTPDEGYEFKGWLDGNKSNPRTVTMTGNVVLSASCVEIAKPTYTLSASVTNGKVSAKRNGSAVNLPFTANEGDTIVLEVTPNDGYTFEGWNDGNTDNPRTITMNADVVLSAQCVEVVQPPVGNYIPFEDKAVEAICVANWSSDGIGLTMEDAAAVTDIGLVFNKNTEIKRFNEFRYFVAVRSLRGNDSASNIAANGAFYGCSALQSIQFPPSLETINGGAFGNTTALAINVDIPSLKNIRNNAFRKSGITSITNLGTITELGTFGTIDYGGEGVFYGCANLTTAEIPSSVINIPAATFYNCSALTKIICRATIPPTLGNYAFNNTNNCPIYVPDASLEAYKTAVNWNTYADRIHPLSEIEGGHITTYEGLIGAYTFEGRSNEDADRDIVEDKSGYNNTLTLKSMQWGFIHDSLPDLIREGLWDDALWISQSGYGEIVLPKGLTDFTVIAKRAVYSVNAGRNWSPLVGTGKSSGKGLFWFEYVDDNGRYTNQANGLKYTLSSLESESTWMTNTHYNGHRLTGTQGNNVHDGMVYINKFRGDVSGTKIQKIYAIYLFNRQLSPSEIEAFIKEHIDADYVLPTIEQ